jgi:hypothetical protein
MKPIPPEFIRKYIDQLLLGASKLPDGGMKTAVLLRADSVMDLVKAWKESQNG